MNSVVRFIISLALPLIVGGVAGSFTARAIPTWYATLRQPPFNPPNWIFGPVWSTLYLLMGLSLYWIWSLPESKERNIALGAFVVQLIFNFGWSFIFFYFREIGIALGEIILMWISILTMIILFYQLKPTAAYINIPYLMWVSFATVLNAAYFRLN